MTKIEKQELISNVAPEGVSVDSANEEIAVGFNTPSEYVSGLPESSGSSSGSQFAGIAASAPLTPAQILKNKREQLIASKPEKALMVNDIEACLKKEIRELKAEESKLAALGLKAINKYNDVMAKMREVYKILNSLVNMGYDQLKAMWLKLVHNIV